MVADFRPWILVERRVVPKELKMSPNLTLGGDSIDILDGLNPSLNPSLNHFSIQCLPKRVLNLVLNPSLNPSLKF